MLTTLFENEILYGRLIRSLSFRRLINLAKAAASFVLSTVLKKPIVWGVPPILTIEPTNICNLHCPLCSTGSGEMERPTGMMTLDTFKRLMDVIGNEMIYLLIYFQGEPYMNKRFFDFVRIAKSKNIYVTTSTNGHFFTPATIEATLECGLDSMIVSIDGVTPESYARYRVGGELERVVEGLRHLLAERRRRKSRTPNVAIQFLVMRHNEHEIGRMQELTKAVGADKLLVKSIEVRSLEEARTWLPGNAALSRYDVGQHDFVAKRSPKESCSWPWFSGLMNWDGTFVPCCFDKHGHYPMGNVEELSTFADVWMAGPFQRFRKRLLENRRGIDMCRNCNQSLEGFLPRKLWR